MYILYYTKQLEALPRFIPTVDWQSLVPQVAHAHLDQLTHTSNGLKPVTGAPTRASNGRRKQAYCFEAKPTQLENEPIASKANPPPRR